MKQSKIDQTTISIYRKRIIPDECILLKNDRILETASDFIITKWETLKPRQDFCYGYSCYYLEEGCKVSKFYRKDNSLLYCYCDIVDYQYQEAQNALIVTDLLADVIIYPNGYVKVLDINELAEALDKMLCPPQLVSQALIKLDKLLTKIYNNQLNTLTAKIDKWIPT